MRRYPQVDGNALKEAIRAVNNGSTQRDAAISYGISKTTLNKYMKWPMEDIPDVLTQGKFKNIFTDEQEEQIIRYALEMSRRFYALTRKALGELAFHLAEKNRIKHPFKNGSAGEDWILGFMKRHKARLSLRTGQQTSLKRIEAFTKAAVYGFFDNLERVIREKGISREAIYNVDETGITVVPSIEPKRIAERGAKLVQIMSAEERGQLVTLICCFSATGDYVPPLFVFPKCSRVKDISDGPDGSTFEISDNGWSTVEVFLKWLKHFRRHSRPSAQNPVLLILDNHTSHISYRAVRYCRKYYITILTLCPHSSHRLQPLDVAFFSPLKTRYGQAITEWTAAHPFKKPLLKNIPEILKSAYDQAAKPETAVKGFEKTGIYVGALQGPSRLVFKEEDFFNLEESEDSADENGDESDGSDNYPGPGGNDEYQLREEANIEDAPENQNQEQDDADDEDNEQDDADDEDNEQDDADDDDNEQDNNAPKDRSETNILDARFSPASSDVEDNCVVWTSDEEEGESRPESSAGSVAGNEPDDSGSGSISEPEAGSASPPQLALTSSCPPAIPALFPLDLVLNLLGRPPAPITYPPAKQRCSNLPTPGSSNVSTGRNPPPLIAITALLRCESEINLLRSNIQPASSGNDEDHSPSAVETLLSGHHSSGSVENSIVPQVQSQRSSPVASGEMTLTERESDPGQSASIAKPAFNVTPWDIRATPKKDAEVGTKKKARKKGKSEVMTSDSNFKELGAKKRRKQRSEDADNYSPPETRSRRGRKKRVNTR